MIFLEKMKTDIQQLTPVSAKAAALYEKAEWPLINEVITYLEINSISGGGIKTDTIGSQYDNCRYHFGFMTKVFSEQNFDLMIVTIASLYRTYKNRGMQYDAFPKEFSAWKYAVDSYLPSIEANEILSVYDWLISKHAQFIAIAESDANLLNSTDTPLEDTKRDFLELLFKGDSRKVLGFAQKLVHSPESLKEFYLKVLQPALYEIGHLWETGKISVAHEHLASSIIATVMVRLYAQYVVSEPTKGLALITAALNEYHEIGPRMVADFLEMDGWDVRYLGANTPEEDVVVAIEEFQPDIVGIGIAMPFNITSVSEQIMKIQQSSKKKKPFVVVGGSAINYIADLWKKTGADRVARDAEDFLALANKYWNECKGRRVANDRIKGHLSRYDSDE